jgi:predicted nucleic acid-binding protein
MKVLIDTNIILDILLARAPFLEPAKKLIRMMDEGHIHGYITANSITDIVYVARKTYSPEEIWRIISDLLDRIAVIGIDREVIIAAFELGFNDFEDALQSACSEREQLDLIVTRDKNDFSKSAVVAEDISDFIAKYEKTFSYAPEAVKYFAPQ